MCFQMATLAGMLSDTKGVWKQVHGLLRAFVLCTGILAYMSNFIFQRCPVLYGNLFNG